MDENTHKFTHFMDEKQDYNHLLWTNKLIIITFYGRKNFLIALPLRKVDTEDCNLCGCDGKVYEYRRKRLCRLAHQSAQRRFC